jgi:hypothetical protein
MKTLNSKPRITFNWRIELRPEWGNQNWVMPGWSGAMVLSSLPVTARDKDAAFDLAMAMAELRNVAAERDSFKAGRADLVAVLATYSAERDKAQIECCEANARADFADLAAERRGVELEKLRLVHRDAVAGWNKAALERDNARQSLRAAEQEVEELDTLCNDFRRANARLVAERDAAMERLNHAESIIMQ